MLYVLLDSYFVIIMSLCFNSAAFRNTRMLTDVMYQFGLPGAITANVMVINSNPPIREQVHKREQVGHRSSSVS